MKDELARAMFVSHHRYRVDSGMNLPEHEKQRRFPPTSIEDVEAGKDSVEQMWSAMHWRETEPFRYYTQAVHTFLGVEKGKELTRGAVATMVAALRLVQRPLEGAATTYPNHQMDIHAALNAIKAALRAAGEEVE